MLHGSGRLVPPHGTVPAEPDGTGHLLQETLKPQEVRDFLRAAQLKTSADVLQRGEGPAFGSDGDRGGPVSEAPGEGGREGERES